MSSGKRRFSLLGIHSSDSSSNNRAKSPAGQATAGNAALAMDPLTQPTQLQDSSDSQPRSSNHNKAKEAAKVVLSKLKKSVEILKRSFGVFPPLAEAAEILQEALDVIEASVTKLTGTNDIQGMASDFVQEAARFVTFLEENYPVRMSKETQDLINVLRAQAVYLKEQAKKSSTREDECEKNLEELGRCHRQVEGALRLLVASLLNQMSPAHDALFDSSYADKIERGPCLENTRATVLDGIRGWIHNPNETKVYWINGMAGTGKTTIAYSICEELARSKQLGASYFVSRTSSACQDVSRILPTIAYQLAHVSDSYRSALCQILDQELDLGQRKLSVQFEYLMEIPLQRVVNKIQKGLVVVIDALDECANPKSTEMIVRLLFQHASELPVRFFLTSRPEPAVIDAIQPQNAGSRSVLYLHNVEKQLVQADIKIYLNVSLARLQPTGDQIEWLAEQAGVLFIYAATVVRYVLATGLGTKATARLKAILAPSSTRPSKKDRAIDLLYKAILERVLQDEEQEEYEVEIIERVLWTVVCAREPVTKRALAALTQVDYDQVTAALHPLQSVIHVHGGSDIVSTLHASFPEFVLNHLRSGPLSCDGKGHNQYLATSCFGIMKEHLRFNICGLESSYDFDKNVPDIAARVEAAISPGLFYACRFWAEHLTQAAVIESHFQDLDIFLNLQLLFWMEVLNLKDWMKNGPKVLKEAETWLTANQGSHELLEDALDFVGTFAANSVNSSTPHIYLSHLSMGPKHNRVRQCYQERTKGLLMIEGTLATALNDPMEIMHTQRINSIAVSPDGSKISSSSDDGTIRMWDSYTGHALASPSNAIAGSVEVVVFSPDGRLLASASGQIIQIWNADSGALVLEPMVVHNSPNMISSACFSPDGARLALAETHEYIYTHAYATKYSLNLTVVNAATGNILQKFTLPDEYGARSVAFSSDGTFVLSLLFNGRVLMWNSYTGDTYDGQANPADTCHLWSSPVQRAAALKWDLCEPFTNKHTGPIMVNVSSPKEEYVTCGYYRGEGASSCEIILRDSRTDTSLADPFGWADEQITAFTFSSDGACIISGSHCFDSTILGSYHNGCIFIRIWNIPKEPNSRYNETLWMIGRDGWVRDQDSQPIVWVPEGWRQFFPLPPNSLCIGYKGSLRVTAVDLLTGKRWAECYSSNTLNSSLQMEL
ncbi:hypothetical protein FRC11_002526 [Ceratobasidium sp. 423]|nr:hypothetical protein FRC11_002526 [Ceratobasidium sp. 423]